MYKTGVGVCHIKREFSVLTDGNAIEIYSQGDNASIFKAQGSEVYEVIVKLDDGGADNRDKINKT